MKKFTQNFFREEQRPWHVLRRIGLSLIVVFWTFVSAFGQENQRTIEYYADGPANACYNLSNDYQVQVSFKDLVLVDTFYLELTYDKAVFDFAGVANVHTDLSTMTVTETVGSPLNTLVFKWGNGPAAPITIGDNAKVPVFKLNFKIDGYPHAYGVVNQTVFTSALTWKEANCKFWNITGTPPVQSPVTTKQAFNGNLTVTQQWSSVVVDAGVANCNGTQVDATVTTPANVSGMEYSFNGQTWLNGASTSVPAPSTNNTVRVLNGSCVSFIKSFDVSAAAPLSFIADSPVEVDCPGGNGDLTIVAAGGTPAYKYYVVPDADWAAVSAGLLPLGANVASILANYTFNVGVIQKPAGTYWVAVQDANGCATISGPNMLAWWQEIEVVDNRTPWDVDITKVDATCNGQPDGEISIAIAGGTPWKNAGYNIIVNGSYKGKGFSASSGTTLNNWVVGTDPLDPVEPSNPDVLAPGNYWIVVQDSLGCQWQDTVVIAEPAAIQFAVGHTDTGCGENNGKLWVDIASIQGGTGDLADWKWRYSTHPEFVSGTVVEVAEVTDTVKNLAAGVYYIQIEDSVGCTGLYENAAGDDAVKLLKDVFNVTFPPILCYGGNTDVTIVRETGGGNHTYQYSMDNATWQSSNVFNDLVAGIYDFYIKDVTIDCVLKITKEITQPTRFRAQIAQMLTIPPTCAGNTDGNLVIRAWGGTPFVSESGREYYKWKLDNNGWVQASEFNTFAIDTARHNILVEDANGCTVQLMFDWNNDVNFIDFQDTIYNTCTLDRINLFNADPGNDWWEEVGLDQGFLLDYSWYGTPTEHIDGNQVWEYWYWTSDSGWQIAVFQAVQQIRDPKLYWSSTNNTADAIIAEGKIVGHTTSFGAGTYWVVAMDEWGCKSNVDKIVIVDPAPLAVDITVKPAGCAGSTDGLIMIEAFNGRFDLPTMPGTGDRRYQYILTQQPQIFNHPNWLEQVRWANFTNNDIENDSLGVLNVQKGTYWLAVRDYCGMLNPELIQFVGPIEVGGADPIEFTYAKTNVTCYVDGEDPSDDGTFEVTSITGGFGDYTYKLTGPVTVSNKTGHFTGLPAGSYTLTILSGTLGCPKTFTFAITQPEPLKLELQKVNASCYAAQDGIIRYIITGGTAPYQESTNNGANWFAIAKDPVGGVVKFDRRAGAGSYQVMVKDAKGCEYGPITVTINQPAALSVNNVVVKDVSCSDDSPMTGTNNDGQIKLNIVGGWNAADDFKYTVTATKGTTTKTVSGVDVNGEVTFTGLTAGVWTIKVVEKDAALYANPYILNPAYATAYADGFPSEFQNPDANCFYTTNITVGEPAKITYTIAFNDVKCRNTATGSIVLSNIAGGTKPYTLKLEGPVGSAYQAGVTNTLGATATSYTWNNLPHGHYNVFIQDAKGCSLPYESAEVNNVDSLMLSMELIENAKCFGGNGQIKVNATGGVGGFQYAVVNFTFNFANLDLNTLAWQTSPIFAVPYGDWVGFVKDANGCVQGYPTTSNGTPILHHRVMVLQPTKVIVDPLTHTAAKCYNSADGIINFTGLTGGNGAAYSAVVTGKDFTGAAVNKSYANVTMGANAGKLTGLKASTTKITGFTDADKYTVVFYDQAGCASDPVKVAVTQPEEFIIDLYVTQDAFICPDDLAGVFEIRTISGGVGTKQYRYEAWDGNTRVLNAPYGAINTFQGPAGLLYKVQAKDANGCESQVVEKFVAKPEEVTFTVEDLSCYGDAKGSARVTATGTEGRTFKVVYRQINPDGAWSAPSTSFAEEIEFDKVFNYGDQSERQGHYAFKVVDNLGCESLIDTVTFVPVQHPLALQAVVSAPGECTSDIAITVTGGITPYVVMVDGEVVTSMSATLAPGDHTVMVIDAHECEVTTTVAVVANPVNRTATATTYVGETVKFVDAEAGVDEELAAGVHVFEYTFNGCPRTLTVTVTEEVRYVTIKTIQGEVAASPLVDKVRGITGTVTGVLAGQGFFVQDASAAWSGIWVADATTSVQEGNGVKVEGTVKEVDGVTTLVASKVTVINPPVTITPVLVDSPQAAEVEMYESVLVKVHGARANAAGTDGTWVIYTTSGNDITVNKWLYTSVPVADHFYDVTGIVNGKNGAYKLEPRKAADVVDLNTVGTPVTPVPGNLQFNVYPNPFNDHLNIDNNDKLTRVMISNIAGQRVIDVQYPGHVIRTANLVSGVYVVTLFNEQGVVKTERIIKR